MIAFLKEYILRKWWNPILIVVLACVFYFIAIPFRNRIVIILADALLIFGVFQIIIAFIWQFIRGRWYYALIQVGAFGLVILLLLFVIAPILMYADKDIFADKLEIPENIELHHPIDLDIGKGVRPSIAELDSLGDKTFKLYNSFQGGLYEYDLWIISKDSGTIYLRAFEITKGTELSESRLRERSSIRVFDTGGKVNKFGTDHHFTIYEGDWEQFYGARFEVWFEPDNGDEEYKILEKNYVIQGWMR